MTDIRPEADDLRSRLAFIREAGKLKDVLRSGRTAKGRQESTAEHSYRLALLVLALDDLLPKQADRMRLFQLALIHDLGELYCGDTPAIMQRPDDGRHEREAAGYAQLTSVLPVAHRIALHALREEYEAGESLEARLIKGLDKIETILHHLDGDNGPDFDHGFNLDYGRRWTDATEFVATIRALIDIETRARLTDSKSAEPY